MGDFTGRHALYRFFDDDHGLLYIGRTNDLRKRFDGHARKQPWWPEVADCKVEFWPDAEALAKAERDAIIAERPKYNIIYNGVVVPEEYEDEWLAPWLAISPRVTAAANEIHEHHCRQREMANCPPGDYIPSAPCGDCFRVAASALGAADVATGQRDEQVDNALDAYLHAAWVDASEREERERSEDREALPLRVSPRLPWLPVGPCECRACVASRSAPATAGTVRGR